MRYDIERHQAVYNFDPEYLWDCFVTEEGNPVLPTLVGKKLQTDRDPNKFRKPAGYDAEMHSLYNFNPAYLQSLCQGRIGSKGHIRSYNYRGFGHFGGCENVYPHLEIV